MFWHILAVVIAVVWGTTFVSSKILLNGGMSPAEIMTIRFLIAYLCILPISLHKLKKSGAGLKGLFCDSFKDEMLMLLLGITGGSLYFLLENSALEYTQASNVSIIVCINPLLTMFAVLVMERSAGRRHTLGWKPVFFSILALAGVVMVILNGELVLKLHPMGDMLSLGAAVMWVAYSLILLSFRGKYSTEMITRKVFIYGIVTMLPVFLFSGWNVSLAALEQPRIWGNLLFLGLVASLGCFYGWNGALKRIGAVRANNYLYLNPLATALLAIPVLHESFTVFSALGALLILGGMYLAQRATPSERSM